MENTSPELTQEQKDRVLREWSRELLDRFELEDVDLDIDALLGLAGVAAHQVIRPAAPLTTFVVGLAAGMAAASGQTTVDNAISSAVKHARSIIKSRSETA
ncbi:hypothetical protein HD598_000995 [Neomicrococcus aestuarii]|uniref:DUF6457 domain-containing protein n=1 Tax=Neomicrococcus aestuarii TaxID=556325 RepID=A0A7W8TUK0_9MICC|nr:DUF6457 domain-containing protein [Neomicrococcus aestuarii]MBB5512308.1 hypothetical protein [Neomicrococcus aestuarii]